MSKEHLISTNPTLETLLIAFKEMIAECDAMMNKKALNVLRYPDAFSDDRDLIFMLLGQRELLGKIVWAVSVEAYDDGCEPEISIKDEL